jgi:hypothetical protein
LQKHTEGTVDVGVRVIGLHGVLDKSNQVLPTEQWDNLKKALAETCEGTVDIGVYVIGLHGMLDKSNRPI